MKINKHVISGLLVASMFSAFTLQALKEKETLNAEVDEVIKDALDDSCKEERHIDFDNLEAIIDKLLLTYETVKHATPLDKPDTLVKRDCNGSFAANNVTLDGSLTTKGSATIGTDLHVTDTLYLNSSTHIVDNAGQTFFYNSGSGSCIYLGLSAGNFGETGLNSNTAIGYQALQGNTNSQNTGLGFQVLQDNTGFYNVGLGGGSLIRNTGDYNIGLGSGSLLENVGNDNIALGRDSLESNTGSGNIALGSAALFTNSGAFNIAIGSEAMFGNVGSNNIALGKQAGFGIDEAAAITGDNNILIGNQAGYQLGAGADNIFIGNVGKPAESKTIRLGDRKKQTHCFIAGIRGKTTGVADAVPVMVDSKGQLGTISSSEKYKDDIQDMAEKSACLMELRPVTFTYKGQKRELNSCEYGLIAEEVAEICPELVVYKDGAPETVRYHLLAPMLLNEYQQQNKKLNGHDKVLDEHDKKFDGHAADINDLNNIVNDLLKRLDRLEK